MNAREVARGLRDGEFESSDFSSDVVEGIGFRVEQVKAGKVSTLNTLTS